MTKLLGKTRIEIEEMLKNQDVIELNLSEKRKSKENSGDLRIYDTV